MSPYAATTPTTVTIDSPIGELELAAQAGAIREIRLVEPAGRRGGPADGPSWSDPDGSPAGGPSSSDSGGAPSPGRVTEPFGTQDAVDDVLAEASRQLAEYFAGRRRAFDLPLAASGTPFQVKVWQALAGVGYGQTTTYAELARSIGKPLAARAVGVALARNPLPIVVPCHRVIGAAGDLRGFGLGGLAVKRSLLDAEAAHLRLSAGAPATGTMS